MASIHLGSGNGFPGLLSALNIDGAKDWNGHDITNLGTLTLEGSLFVGGCLFVDDLIARRLDRLYINATEDMIPANKCLKISGYDMDQERLRCAPIDSLSDLFFGVNPDDVPKGEMGGINIDGVNDLEINLSAGTIGDTVFSDENGDINLLSGVPVGFLAYPGNPVSVVYFSRAYQINPLHNIDWRGHNLTNVGKAEVVTANKKNFNLNEVWDTDIGVYHGFVHVVVPTDQVNALFLIAYNVVTEISDPTNSFGVAAGASDYNVYYVGTNLQVENKVADGKLCYVALYGGMPG